MDDSNTAKRVLLVDDEPDFVIALADLLTSHGYLVNDVADGLDARGRIVGEIFDLVLLDVSLPRMNGFDVCRNVREQGVLTPILMLTARGQISDKVQGLQIGADDYLAKPFDPGELLARVSALLRRASAKNPATHWYEFGNIKVDMKKGRLFREGERLELSEREFALLRYLIENQGQVISRDELLVHVWAYSTAPKTRTVDVHIGLLRQKLERDPRNPQFVVTVHSQGYRFLG